MQRLEFSALLSKIDGVAPDTVKIKNLFSVYGAEQRRRIQVMSPVLSKENSAHKYPAIKT